VAEVGALLGHIGAVPVEELAAALSGLSVGAITAALITRVRRLRSGPAAGRRGATSKPDRR